MNAQPQSFDPASVDPRALREALGRFATGVTVVTCQTDDGPLGMTANSFASVSLDPPLVLWSPAKSSQRHDAFVRSTHFAVHVAEQSQADVCTQFAKDGRNFDGVDWQTNGFNVPLLNGWLSRFECVTEAVHPGGDHSIIVGRVTRVTTLDGQPLIFAQGKYGSFNFTS